MKNEKMTEVRGAPKEMPLFYCHRNYNVYRKDCNIIG